MERPISYRPQPVQAKSPVQEEKKYCLLCEDQPQPPVLLCGTCKIPLCSACFQKHTSVPRYAMHRSIPFEEISWCSVHFKRHVLFCEDCREKCCIICANFGSHKGHSVVDREVSFHKTLSREAKETEDLRQSVYSRLLATLESLQSLMQRLSDFETEGCRRIREEANRRRQETHEAYQKMKDKLETLHGLSPGKNMKEREEVQKKMKEMQEEFDDSVMQPSDFQVTLTFPAASSSFRDHSDLVIAEEDIQIHPIHAEAKGSVPDQFFFSPSISSAEQIPSFEEVHSDFSDEQTGKLQSEKPQYIYTLCNDSDKVIRLDMKTEVWELKTADRTWPKFCNFTLIDESQLIVTGGGHVPSKRTYLLDLHTFTSTEQQSMSTARNHHGIIKVSAGVFVLGGICKAIQAHCECFALESNTWREVAPLTHSRAAMGVCGLNEDIYVFGGWDGHKEISSIETYSVQTGKWSVFPLSLPMASQCNAVVYESRILVFAFKPQKIYELHSEKMTDFGLITNEAWCRPELQVFRDVIYSFRSGELKVIKYRLKEGCFNVLGIEE